MFAPEQSAAPATVAETIKWLLRLNRPPLPECPIEAAKIGREAKAPCFFDGRRVIPLNWKQWQKELPIADIYQTWFSNPKNGIGTLGGWNGKHWLGWTDFDTKNFASKEECDRAIALWMEQYPITANCPRFRTPGGGYRFLVAFSKEPRNFRAVSGFSLKPDGTALVGELLSKNGGHTLLPPTIGVNGKPYHWEFWSEYPPVIERPEDIGLFPVQRKTENDSTPTGRGSSAKNNLSISEFLERDVYSHLTPEVAFSWSGHDFKEYGDKLKGCCPWHESQSGTAFYCQVVDGKLLWRCPACELGGDVIAYRHRLAGGDGSPRGREFVDIVRQLAAEVGLEMPPNYSKKPETEEPVEPTSSRFSNGGRPASSVSLRDRVLEILARNYVLSERKSAFIALAESVKAPMRELEQLADLIESEEEQSDGREQRKKELDRLLQISARRLTLDKYLHHYLARPLERVANWMGVEIESLLTILLPTAASLLNPQSRVVVKECIDFAEPLIFYSGVVTESGNRKSPIFKVITKGLRLLQDEEDVKHTQALAEYEEELKRWKRAKPDERDECPEPPPPPREFFVENCTSEALDRIKAQQPQHGILIRKDELSGLFGSYNSYRGGRGSDKEGILSGWNGLGVKVNRASGSRLSLSHDASSIAGTIQPGKLRQIMGGLEDEQGEWARFIWFLAPLKAFKLPQSDAKFEVGELLEGIFRKLDNLPPVQYRFSAEAQQVYDDYHWQLEQRKLAEPRQGMRSAIAKMEGYCARFAGILHILWEAAADQEPSEKIPPERVLAAAALAEFYLGQVRLIHSDGEADSGELSPMLKKILEKARQLNGITARVAKQSIKALKGTSPPKVREYLSELVAMGYGVIEGQGNRSKFIPKTVDLTVDLTKNAETPTNTWFSPISGSNCRPTVDPSVDPVKTGVSYTDNGLQETVDPNCRPVDHFSPSSKDPSSGSTSISSTGSDSANSITLNVGLQVYSSAETLDSIGVEAVDPWSTVRSTVDKRSTVRSTVTAEKSDKTGVDPVDFWSTDDLEDFNNDGGGSKVVSPKPPDGGGGTDAIAEHSESPAASTNNNISDEPKNQNHSASIESDRALVSLVEEDGKQRLVVNESGLDLYRGRGFDLPAWIPTREVKPYEQLRRVVVDIETLGLNPEADRIIAIGLKLGEETVILSNRDEAAMLKEFNNLLAKWQPDVISGHNIMAFDAPFITKRCALHGVKSPFRISDRESCLRATVVNGKPITYKEVYARDKRINVVDTYYLAALFDKPARQLTNLKLKSAVLELGLRKEARLELSAEQIKAAWHSGDFQIIEEYLRYDLEDTELLMDCLLPQYHYLSIIVPGMNLQSLVLRGHGSKWQRVLERYYRSSPEADTVPHCDGAERFAEKAGLFRNVASVDVASLYPSIQLKYGVCSSKDPDRYSLQVLQYLTDERLRLKKLGKAGDVEAKRQSDALKILLNSLTGMLGTRGIPFNDPVAFSLVTSYGRRILNLMAETIEDCGGKVAFGDTDGIVYAADDIPTVYKKLVEILPEGIKLDAYENWDALYIPLGKDGQGAKCTYIYWKDGKVELKGGRYTNRDNPLYQREYEIGFLSQYLSGGLTASQSFHDDFIARLNSGDLPTTLLSCRRIVQHNSKFKDLGEVGEKTTYWIGENGNYTNSEAYSRQHYVFEIEKLNWQIMKTLGHDYPKPNRRKKKATELPLVSTNK